MNDPRPLLGKRILVTRTRHQAGRLAELLEASGASTLLLPTIAIAPPISYAALDTAMASIESFNWLILTSVNAVRALRERMRMLAIDSSRLDGIRIAAVGPATAEAVRENGMRVDLMPEEYVAEAVTEMLKGSIRGWRVLLVRAAVARDVIPEELGRRGADVFIAEAYRTVLPPESIETAQALFAQGAPPPDAFTFTSSSTVKNFFALLDAAKLKPPGGHAVSIGPMTTHALREHGWEPAIEAREATVPGLVEACVRLLGPGL